MTNNYYFFSVIAIILTNWFTELITYYNYYKKKMENLSASEGSAAIPCAVTQGVTVAARALRLQQESVGVDARGETVPAPSPQLFASATIPEPEPDGVICDGAPVLAQAVPTRGEHVFDFQFDGATIKISIQNTSTNIKYYREITEADKFWKETGKYFHSDFRKFFVILRSTAQGDNSQIIQRLETENPEYITIVLQCDGLLSFIGRILVRKEEDKITRLERLFLEQEKRIQSLEATIIANNLGTK